MRKRLLSVVVLLLFSFTLSISAPGQSRERRGWGYVFFGAGGTAAGSEAFIHTGGGGEGLLYKGFGVGAEIGAFTPVTSGGKSLGLASLNLAGHFNRSGRLDPFVTGGASLAFRNGSAGGGNFGGGVQWWFKNRAALRLEFRDHIFSSDTPHFYSFRVGLSFR
jgi:hypothetical protein